MKITKQSISLRNILCLTALLSLIPNHLSHAGGEFSGGSIFKAFKAMSPEQAFESNKFKKRVWNIHMPGTSTWYKPSTSLCIEGNTLQTIYPRLRCDEWTVKLKKNEFGKRTRSYKYKGQADQKAESSNGSGKPFCTKGYYRHDQAPLSKTHLTYIAEFYKKTHGGEPYDDDNFLGEHEYPVLECIFFNRPPERPFPEEEILEASGEYSGNGDKKEEEEEEI